jgi:cysteinyl-tRNA synthetase
LDDDLNISAALAEVFVQVRETNQRMDLNELTPGQAAALLRWWEPINYILQIQKPEVAIPPAVQELIAAREQARTNRDWQLSDRLRKQIESLGWTVKDTKEGQKASLLP